MNRLTLVLLLMLVAAGCRIVVPCNRTYTNPVGGSVNMGDPFVLEHGSRYYLFGTTDPGEGFRCFTSHALVGWEEGWLMQVGQTRSPQPLPSGAP